MAGENTQSVNYGTKFKSVVSNGYNKTKRFVKEKYDVVKVKAKEYGSKVNKAYNVGYFSGVKDYPSLPKTFGAQTSATYGYSRGLKDSHRNQKYQNKVKK